MAGEIKYVEKYTTPPPGGTKRRTELLWGDRVRVLDAASARWRVKAPGAEGYIDPAVLGTRSLLEVYFIDVGQGDGVLVRFPDDRHGMIDGGYNRSKADLCLLDQPLVAALAAPHAHPRLEG